MTFGKKQLLIKEEQICITSSFTNFENKLRANEAENLEKFKNSHAALAATPS